LAFQFDPFYSYQLGQQLIPSSTCHLEQMLLIPPSLVYPWLAFS
jgi:hypothetical protein